MALNLESFNSSLNDPSSFLGSSGAKSLLGGSLSSLVGNPKLSAATKLATSTSKKKTAPEYTKERLYLTRPRYASDDISNRGTHAYIKLLTSKEQSAEYKNKNSYRTKSKSQLSSTLSESLQIMSGESTSTGYDKFLLGHVSASLDEKLQVTEVFGDNEVAYYFGRQPMMFAVSGFLMDSVDNNWFSDWLVTYAGALRGTELAKNFELLKIVLPNMTLIGSITSCKWDQDSNNDTSIPFTFQILVKELIPTPVVPLGKPISNSATKIDFKMSGESFAPWKDILSLKSQGAKLVSTIKNPLSSVSSVAASLKGIGMGVCSASDLDSITDGIAGFQGKIDSFSSSVTGIGNDVKGSSLFSSLTSGLAGVRASLFSPIYGVMNSLTKLVKNVFGTVDSVFNALTAPVKNILSDISSIANQAVNLVNSITAGVSAFGRNLSGGYGLVSSIKKTLASLKKAKGSIAKAPSTIADAFKYAFNSGKASGAAFLVSRPRKSLNRPTRFTSKTNKTPLSPQLAILSSKPPVPAFGAAL